METRSVSSKSVKVKGIEDHVVPLVVGQKHSSSLYVVRPLSSLQIGESITGLGLRDRLALLLTSSYGLEHNISKLSEKRLSRNGIVAEVRS